MKKIIARALCLVLAATMMVSMASCATDTNSKPNSNSGGTTPPSTANKTKLSFWTIIPIGADGYDTLNELVLGFNSTQDKYEIEHVGYPFLDYFGKMTTAFSGGVAPDVFMYTLDDVPVRASTGTIADLTPFIEKDKYDLSDFYENELEFGKYDGKQYALPFSSTCRLLYYNLDMFKEAGLTEADVPKTWDELYDVAHKMDVAPGGKIERLGFDPTAGHANYFTLLWQSGLDFFDKDGNPMITGEKHTEVLQWMLDFNKQYPVSQRQAFTDAGKTLAADPFASGRLGMMVGNDQNYKILQNANVDFEYGVAPLPMPENGVRVNWSSCWSLEAFESGNVDKIEGAWEFMKYMSTPENAAKFYDSQGWLTASKKANETLKIDPIMAKIVEELPYSTEKMYFDFAPKWHEDWNQFQEKANVEGDAKAVLKDAQKFYEEKKSNYAATHK